MKISTVIWKCRPFLLVGILVWLLCIIFHPFEPRYEGRRLSAWAADLLAPDEFWDTLPASEALAKQDKAVAAIRHFGIKAMPLAIKWCGAEDSALEEKLKDWINGQKIFQVQIPSDSDYQRRGVKIFEVLGPIAKPAIPSLIKLLGEKDHNAACIASSDLVYIGPDAIPPLIDALKNQNAQVRRIGSLFFGGIGGKFQAAYQDTKARWRGRICHRRGGREV